MAIPSLKGLGVEMLREIIVKQGYGNKIECTTVARKWYSKRERDFRKIDFGSPTEAPRVRELLKKD
jgi:hypothetical protein